MKITNQNPPPELATLYATLVSTNSTGAGAGAQARTRRGARVRPSKKRKPDPINDFDAAADALIAYLLSIKTSAANLPKKSAIISELKRGIFDPKYWKKCQIISTDYLGSVPTSVPDTNPPPYAYRDPLNQPTEPTYSQGLPDVAPARYSGLSSGVFFYDQSLVWSATIFKLRNKITDKLEEPAILAWNPQITAHSDMRGSRPMLGLLIRANIEPLSDPNLYITDPPTYKLFPTGHILTRQVKSLYFRFELPVTAAPFYTYQHTRKVTLNLLKIASISNAPDMTRALVIAAPRPMFGRGYNNNLQVDTSIQGIPDIYQINKDRLTIVGWLSRTDRTEAFRWTAADDFEPLGFLPNGTFSYARSISADGLIIVGYSNTPSLGRGFRWTRETGMIALSPLPGGTFSDADCISSDGSIIAGRATTATATHATIWPQSGIPQDIHTNPTSAESSALGISADGSVIVGYMLIGNYPHAFRWSAATGMLDLGTLPGGLRSYAYDVSADGSVIVGWSNTPTQTHAFRWTAATGMVDLGLPPGAFQSQANAISPDGLTIIGSYATPTQSLSFRWTLDTGMVDLGIIPGGTGTFASSISRDGLTIIGYCSTPTGAHAFTWTEETGIIDIGKHPDFTNAWPSGCT